MTVAAPIIQIRRDGSSTPLGEYEFLGMPSSGDAVSMLASPVGTAFQIMRVLYVEHSPIALPRNKASEGQKPTVAVYVEFTGFEEEGS